jgi:hypothetical protein
MILRRCVVCGKDRGISRPICSCGAVENDAGDTFKAVVVVPGSKGKRRSKTCQTLEAALLAEKELQNELQNSRRCR